VSEFSRPRKKTGLTISSSSGRTCKKRRQTETKRCHDCKSTTKYYRNCHYYFPDGSKCAKTFCRKCLEGKYEGEPVDDWKTNKDSMDWL
jgi:hypothetical protein